jgi:hypothetical protein
VILFIIIIPQISGFYHLASHLSLLCCSQLTFSRCTHGLPHPPTVSEKQLHSSSSSSSFRSWIFYALYHLSGQNLHGAGSSSKKWYEFKFLCFMEH